MDPTFAAYVTDENGLLLHPGEVRRRMQHDQPLLLNSDANWNNEWPEEKEDYFDEYMAKNLYIMSANKYPQSGRARRGDRAPHRQDCRSRPAGSVSLSVSEASSLKPVDLR